MIKIDSGVAMPKIRRNAGSNPANVERALKDYTKAYKDLHGVSPLSVEYKDGHFYADSKTGVSLSIFRSKIKSLIYRKG